MVVQRQLAVMALPRYGVRVLVELDDFGTGYASLRYLQKLQFDSLKMARTFVKAIDQDAVSSRLAPMIIEMTASLGLGLVAEGVETETQAAYLRSRGVRLHDRQERQGRQCGRLVGPGVDNFRCVGHAAPRLASTHPVDHHRRETIDELDEWRGPRAGARGNVIELRGQADEAVHG